MCSKRTLCYSWMTVIRMWCWHEFSHTREGREGWGMAQRKARLLCEHEDQRSIKSCVWWYTFIILAHGVQRLVGPWGSLGWTSELNQQVPGPREKCLKQTSWMMSKKQNLKLRSDLYMHVHTCTSIHRNVHTPPTHIHTKEVKPSGWLRREQTLTLRCSDLPQRILNSNLLERLKMLQCQHLW